ncbi:Glycoprotein hormone beta-5 [Mactra antiquata]
MMEKGKTQYRVLDERDDFHDSGNTETERLASNTSAMTGYYVRFFVILIVCIGLTAASDITDYPFLGCRPSRYTMPVSKNITIHGRELYCYDDVEVLSCMGRCDSYEIGYFDKPYKRSHHPVCMYRKTESFTVQLRHCHPDHPDPFYEVFSARACECTQCDPKYVSCENLLG